MPDISAFWSKGDKLTTKYRSEQAWMRIQRDPTLINLRRKNSARVPDTLIPEQTVRLEFALGSGGGQEVGEEGKTSLTRVIVFGVYDHPRVPDTDIKRGDEFTFDNHGYRVVDVIRKQGEIQAPTEALT